MVGHSPFRLMVLFSASLLVIASLAGSATAAKPAGDPVCAGDRYTPKTQGWIGIKAPEFPPNDRFILHDQTPLGLGADPIDGVTLAEFAVHPNDPALLFASNGFTLMRSKDTGCTWEQVYSIAHPPTLGSPHSRVYIITDIVIPENPAASNYVYVVLGERYLGYQAYPVFVVRSEDRGTSWNAPVQPAGVGEYPHLEISPSDPNILYLTAQTGLLGPVQFYKSTDAGATWLPVMTISGRANDYNHVIFGVDPLDPNELWYWGIGQVRETAVNSNLLQHSVDGGRTWTEVTSMGPEPIGYVDIYHDANGPARLVANVYRQPIAYRSDNGGEAWYPISPPGAAYLMAHGDTSDEIVAVNENGYGGLPGMFRYDGRVARRGGYPWVQVTPPSIDSSCSAPYQSLHVTRASPNVIYAAANSGCAGNYPIVRYAGRL